MAQNLVHLPAHGGANRSSRILMEQLARQGHQSYLVAPARGAVGGHSPDGLRRWLGERGIAPVGTEDALSYDLNGVRVRAVLSPPRLAREVRRLIAEVAPDWVLVPSDDPGSLVLAAALAAAPDRVVYCVHTLQQLPFGPRAFAASPATTRMVRRTAGRVAVSRAAQDYLARWAGLDSHLLHPPVYGRHRFAPRDPATMDAVTMVNPCAYKGISIFLGLAHALPEVPFLAVPTWGTTAEDLAALRAQPNVSIMDATDHIDDVLGRTRVLLMPSLWDETFGYTAVEAMLRGIPVLASDVGGLGEAKLGVPHLLPVRPIERYERADRARPVPVVPDQDLGPWRDTLRRLLADQAAWRDLSRRSQWAATRFVDGLDEHALGAYLSTLEYVREPVGSGARG